MIGTLGEDEPESCKSNELIFTKATNNSGGHSKTTVTCWFEAVLSWILFICSVWIVFSTGRRAREGWKAGGTKEKKSEMAEERENMCILNIKMVWTVVAWFCDKSDLRPVKAIKLKNEKWGERAVSEVKRLFCWGQLQLFSERSDVAEPEAVITLQASAQLFLALER